MALGKIKVGALISQDHGIGMWPAQRSGEPIDQEKIFEMDWKGSYWDCKANGYGFHSPRGDYGNGSIFVHDKDGVILDSPSEPNLDANPDEGPATGGDVSGNP